MSQKIIFGNNTIGLIKEVLQQYPQNKPFIIMGEHLQQKQALLFPFEYHAYFKKGVNVLEEEVNECDALFKTFNTPVIIAIGGGSVIDLAKAIVFNSVNNKFPLPFFVCIPTTAGSGSEATSFAVIYKDHVKTSLDKAALLPKAVILDPQLTHSLSPLQTAISGMDALAQAIESYWNIHADAKSKAFSLEAIELLLHYLPVAVDRPTALTREKMLWAAHLAGKAINITRTTGPHALSYYLTAHYNVAHGQAVALFLPLFFVYNSRVHNTNCNHRAGPEKVKRDLEELYTLLQVNNAAEAAQYLQHFIKNTGLAINLEELAIDKYDITGPLLGNINEERFSNNPVSFNQEVIRELCIQYL